MLFRSLVDRDPPRVLVTGRTAYGMSAFGEHLIGEEVEGAATAAAAAIDADITDFAMMAVFPHHPGELGGHRWVVEFAVAPPAGAAERFAAVLDSTLSDANDDYRAHRAGMAPPRVVVVPPGTFADWMKHRGRLGGQNKVPRIINDPALAADLAAFVGAP